MIKNDGEGQLLLRASYSWTPKDSSTDEKAVFAVPEGIDALLFRFSYTPGQESVDELCQGPVEKALKEYYGDYDPSMEPMTVQQHYPIKNLVTLSLTRNGNYIGNAHRWKLDQEHLITTRSASSGFTAPDQLEGEWEVMLHLHEIISEHCSGELEVRGLILENENEETCSDAGNKESNADSGKKQPKPWELVYKEDQFAPAQKGQAAALNWYPVEFHTHTLHSDGSFSVPELVEAMEKHGFRAVGLSDHNTAAGVPEFIDLMKEKNMVPVPALEWTTFFGHMLVLGEQGYTDWRGVLPPEIDPAIRSIHKNKGLVGIAHPKSLSNPVKTGYRWIFDIHDWSNLDFLEVWSRQDAELKVQTRGAFAMWEELLNQGYHIPGTSGRDYHRVDTLSYGHTYVGTEKELTTEEVFRAIRLGRVCVAMGPLLTAVLTDTEGNSYTCGDTVKAGEYTLNWTISGDQIRPDWNAEEILPESLSVVQKGQKVLSLPIAPEADWDTVVRDLKEGKAISGQSKIQLASGWMRLDLKGRYFGKEDIRIAFVDPVYVD